MEVFIELWSPREKWLGLTQSERTTFFENVQSLMGELEKLGIEIIHWGTADKSINHSPFKYFALYQTKNKGAIRSFEEVVQSTGWYEYFDQVNVAGSVQQPHEVISTIINN